MNPLSQKGQHTPSFSSRKQNTHVSPIGQPTLFVRPPHMTLRPADIWLMSPLFGLLLTM